jgi:hypothetical protein
MFISFYPWNKHFNLFIIIIKQVNSQTFLVFIFPSNKYINNFLLLFKFQRLIYFLQKLVFNLCLFL